MGWSSSPGECLAQCRLEQTRTELSSVVLFCFQDWWQTGIGTCSGKALLDKKELQGVFRRVISVLALAQPRYKPYPWKFARLTLLQLNWSQRWRLFRPTLFSPSAPSKAASMQKFVPETEGMFVFLCFLSYPLINLRCTFVPPLKRLTAAFDGNHMSSFAAIQRCESVLVNASGYIRPWDKVDQWSQITFYDTVSGSWIYCFSPMQWMHRGNWNTTFPVLKQKQ